MLALGVNQEARVPVSNMLREVNLCIDKLSTGILERSMEHGDRIGALQRQPDVLGALGEVLSTPLEVAFAELAHVSVTIPQSKTTAEYTYRRYCRCSG
jgi:hypothetical protein